MELLHGAWYTICMSEVLKKSKKNSKTGKVMFFLVIFGFLVISSSWCVDAGNDSYKLAINNSNVINLTNTERVSEGLPNLIESEILNEVAQRKLDNMIEEDYFEHTSPDGVDPWEWFFQSGYDFAYAGENLATEFTDVQKQHDAWMNSPKHKENILNKKFTSTGVAVGERIVEGEDVLVTVQVFATPQKVVIASTNFTPETYSVPDELFRVSNKKTDKASNMLKGSEQLLASADAINRGSANQKLSERNSTVKTSAWIFIGVLVIIVIIVEYRIFAKRRKRS